MSLIKSISGIRGTIGGVPGEGLSPLDVVKFTAAYATFIKSTTTRTNKTIVVGRDARISGEMVDSLVVGTLTGMGFNVQQHRQPRLPWQKKKHVGVSSLRHPITPNSGTH